jgi:hypothetical protein
MPMSAAMFRISFPSVRRPLSQFEACKYCDGHLTRVESFTNIHSDTPVRIYKCSDCQRLTFDD